MDIQNFTWLGKKVFSNNEFTSKLRLLEVILTHYSQLTSLPPINIFLKTEQFKPILAILNARMCEALQPLCHWRSFQPSPRSSRHPAPSPSPQPRLVWPHSSGSWPGSAQRRAREARSPAAHGSGSPWSLSPPALFWTCSSIRSLTYSNIHSVTRGHRGKETIGILSCQRVEVLKRKQKEQNETEKRTPKQNYHPPYKAPCVPEMSFSQPLTRICKKQEPASETGKSAIWRLQFKVPLQLPATLCYYKMAQIIFWKEAL